MYWHPLAEEADFKIISTKIVQLIESSLASQFSCCVLRICVHKIRYDIIRPA